MKNVFLLFALFCSTSLFAQQKIDLWNFVGSWTYEECFNIFTFYPEDNIINVRLTEKETGYTAQMNVLGVDKDSLITELHTPQNNWYVRKVFYIKNHTLIAKTTGNSNMIEYYKKI